MKPSQRKEAGIMIKEYNDRYPQKHMEFYENEIRDLFNDLLGFPNKKSRFVYFNANVITEITDSGHISYYKYPDGQQRLRLCTSSLPLTRINHETEFRHLYEDFFEKIHK